jgi:hypothetical protein
MQDRRVRTGHFGCPNCRASYPVRGGFADFRVPGVAPSPGDSQVGSPEPPSLGLPEGDAEGGLRLAAMLGVQSGPGMLLLLGEPAAQASRLAAMIPDVEVVALHPGTERWPEVAGVSRGVAGAVLPFFTHTMRGVAVGVQPDAPIEMAELVRVLVPGGRLVIEGEDSGREMGLEPWQSAMEEIGMEPLLATDRILVGQK